MPVLVREERHDRHAEGRLDADRPTIGGSRRSSLSCRKRSVGDAHPVVDDAEHVGIAGAAPSDPDRAVGRAERGGVVEQLGEEVGDVGDDVAADLERLERLDLDPSVVLDLTDGGPDDVVDLGGLDATPLWLGVGEHEQRFAVAAHAGGEMVELVVVRQHVGVVDLGLELVEHGELTVDQRSVASGHRDEDVGHTTAQHVDLLVGDVDEGSLHRVERLGELVELVAALDLDRLDVGEHGFAAGVAECFDEGGQLLGGDLVGADGDGLDPPGDRSGDRPGDECSDQDRCRG